MKKIFIPLFAIAILATSCEDKNAYTVTGQIADPSYDSTLVYMKDVSYDRNQLSKVLDSVMVVNGTFTFSGISAAPQSRILQLAQKEGERRPRTAFIVEEAGKIAVSIDSTETTVKGTPLNDGYQAYQSKFAEIDKKGFETYGKLEGAKDNKELEEKLKAELTDLGEQIKKGSYEYAKANIKNPAGLHIFIQNSSNFDNDQVKGLLAELTPEAKEIGVVKSISEYIEALEKTAEGKMFTDLKSKNTKGADVALSDYAGKGKVVLIDFWASWCGPCKVAMPELVELYKNYKNKNFEIVGVSFDSKEKDWVESLGPLNMTWPQMSDLKGWECEAAKVYGIKRIPHTVLLDKSGTIVAKNLHGEELTKKIEELIK